MLQQEKCGLILLDVQGVLVRSMHQSDNLIANIAKLIQACQLLSLPVIWLEQYPQGLGQTVPELSRLLTAEKPIIKHTFNACDTDEVNRAIADSGRQQWLVCGIEAHICVYQTVSALLSKNYQVEVVADGVSSRLQGNTDLALTRMQGNGASLTSVEMCLYELLGDARHKAFKKILALIK